MVPPDGLAGPAEMCKDETGDGLGPLNEPPLPSALPSVIVIVGVGALTGIGAKISNGCTYGHMLCRPSRLSGRSSIAVTTFLPVAMITRHLVHPPKRRLSSRSSMLRSNISIHFDRHFTPGPRSSHDHRGPSHSSTNRQHYIERRETQPDSPQEPLLSSCLAW